MDDAHIVHLLRPRYPKIIQKGLGPELSICRWGPLSADPAASTCPSVQKIRTKGLVRAVLCPGLPRLSNFPDAGLCERTVELRSDVCSVSLPVSEASRPWQQSGAHFGGIISKDRQRIPNKGSCQRIPKDRVPETHRIVSPRNGVVVGFVAGAHCGSCRIVGHWRAGQGCAIK